MRDQRIHGMYALAQRFQLYHCPSKFSACFLTVTTMCISNKQVSARLSDSADSIPPVHVDLRQSVH